MRQHCDVVHHPGYLTITCRIDGEPTLHLSWIPNSTLRKHPTTLENLPAKRALSTDCLHSKIAEEDTNSERLDVCIEVKEPVDCKDCERICSGGCVEQDVHRQKLENANVNISNERPILTSETKETNKNGDEGIVLNRLRSESIDSATLTDSSMFPTWMRSPELLALQHNLAFPDSATASPVAVRRSHACRRFSVDLGQMRSLRLFFADPGCTCGQLVVASRESQYKILHFHHGGLDRLAGTLHQWHQLLNSREEESPDAEGIVPYR